MLPNPDEASGEVKWTDYLPETPVPAVAQTGLFQPTGLAARHEGLSIFLSLPIYASILHRLNLSGSCYPK
jgi:hypothetical protein